MNMKLIIQSTLFNFYFIVSTFVLIIIMSPSLILPSKCIKYVSKIWCFLLNLGMKFFLGLNTKIYGFVKYNKPVIYAVKHQSAWETVITTGLLDMPVIILKRELIFLPIIGLYFLKGGAIPIKRDNSIKSLKLISSSALKAVQKGRSILIFPQGTRVPVNASINDFPYLTGIYLMYSKLNIPVVPIAHNAGLFWPKNSFIKYPNNLKSKNVSLSFMKEIPVGLEKKDFMKILIDKIENGTNKLIKSEL